MYHKLQNSCNTMHPRNVVCLRCIIVNTLQKGGNEWWWWWWWWYYYYMCHKLQNSCNTMYPRNMVCCRYIIVNTLHKGDTKEDDDDDDNDDDDNNNNNNKNNNKTQTHTLSALDDSPLHTRSSSFIASEQTQCSRWSFTHKYIHIIYIQSLNIHKRGPSYMFPRYIAILRATLIQNNIKLTQTYSWIKFIDMPPFILNEVTCVKKS